jgi:hypothetical protein
MKFLSAFYFCIKAPVFMAALAQSRNTGLDVANWLYTGGMDAETETLLDRPDISGVQVLYSWNALEPQQGVYNFSSISHDLAVAKSKGKQLWVQIQDRSFNISLDPVPDYLHQPIYNNGSVLQGSPPYGWVAAQWNDHVRQRFQLLLKALAHHFDGHIYGMNFAESAIDVQTSQNHFNCSGYFDALRGNARFAREVFHTSYVVQYVNFLPCGPPTALADTFAFLANHSIGIGGPDNIPFRPFQEQNSYPLLSQYRNRVPISVIAVQEPDLAAINPSTNKTFTRKEFTDFAINRLGVKIIFWALSSPWLHE